VAPVVYDTDSLQIADLADEIVEPLIVDRTATKDIDVFGCQRLILSKGRVDRGRCQSSAV